MDGKLHNGNFTQSAGGVGRNICEVLGKLKQPPYFLTTIGNDAAGSFLRTSVDPKSRNLIQHLDDNDTSQTAIILDNKGECKLLIGQMTIHETLTSELVKS